MVGRRLWMALSAKAPLTYHRSQVVQLLLKNSFQSLNWQLIVHTTTRCIEELLPSNALSGKTKYDIRLEQSGDFMRTLGQTMLPKT